LIINSAINKANNNIDALIDVLAKWRWMSGINTYNQDENEVAKELVLLSQFIINNYSDINLDEISLAIDLSLTNKLDVDVRTFNTFSPMYVSRILNAYKEYKKPIIKDVLERKEKAIKDKELEKVLTPEEKMESMIDLIKYFYEQNKTEGYINDHFTTLYNYFRKTNKLKGVPNLVNEAKEYGKNKAQEHINDYFADFISNDKPNVELLQKRFARNYCVQWFFNNNDINIILAMVTINDFT
jgi:hypothetical protein